MCPHTYALKQWPEVVERPSIRKPDCHLVLEVDNLSSRVRALVDTFLRIDLGARIKTDAATGTVDIEGRFWKADVIAAVKDLGYRLRHMEERPLSPKPVASFSSGWG